MSRTVNPQSWRAALRLLRRTVVLALVGLAGVAQAASVSFNDLAMDGIFSQASFGSHPIDIRFNPSLSVVAPTLQSIDSNAEFDGVSNSLMALVGQLAIPVNTVSIFFVDAIKYCGGPGTNIIGCGSQPGHLIALDSSAAAGAHGAALMAHELGHNLGLGHLAGDSNLMNGSITGNTTLTASQIGTFLNLSTGASLNPIVQKDGAGLYISITPIAVMAVAAPVPEPQTWAMFALGLASVAGLARRRRAWTAR